MSRPQTITIAGAGLVGSLLSVLLGQRGYKVTIFERRSDMRKEETESGRSINLALSERGIHALKMAGLMEQVEKLLIPMRGRFSTFGGWFRRIVTLRSTRTRSDLFGGARRIEFADDDRGRASSRR